MKVWDNVKWGVRWGAAFGAGYALYAAGLFVAFGAAPFEALGTSAPVVMSLYVVAGITGGLIIGLCRPFTQSRFGAGLVGFLVAVPFFFGVVGASLGFLPWTPKHTVVLVGSAVLVGPMTGVGMREIFRG